MEISGVVEKIFHLPIPLEFYLFIFQGDILSPLLSVIILTKVNAG